MKKLNIFLILFICLCFSLLSISIGFSAMSTSLSVNGSAIVDPIGMIRVVSIKQENISNAFEHSRTFDIDSINVLLDIEKNGSITYKVKIANLSQVDKELTNIENDIFSNDDMDYEIDGLELGRVIKGKENVEFTITFKNNKATDKRLNAKIKFVFENYSKNIIDSTESYKADGECIFKGKGSPVIGECAKGKNVDYIKTNITPFSSENYLRNFILKFTIKDFDFSRFDLGQRDTIFNILYEEDDQVKGKYPGVLLRVEKGKWFLQGSSGTDPNYTTKLLFDRDELLNKEITIIRYNDNGKIGLYYKLGDSNIKLLKDITDLSNTYDTPLTFGASLLIDNKTSYRYATTTLENISFKYIDDSNSLDEMINKDKTVTLDTSNRNFNLTGPCIFNGSTQNITGSCPNYLDKLYIDTDIKLFSQENYQKDFDLSFKIDEYDSNNQEYNQATIMNAFLERTGKGYGILLRKNNQNLNLIIRDGNGLNKELNFLSSGVSTVRIVRKNNNICYSVNDGELKFAIDSSNLIPFDVPLTFGSSLDANKNPFRYIKGTLSNINVSIGQIDKDIMC